MTYSSLEDAIERALSNGFRIISNDEGELVIMTGLALDPEDYQGDLVNIVRPEEEYTD